MAKKLVKKFEYEVLIFVFLLLKILYIYQMGIFSFVAFVSVVFCAFFSWVSGKIIRGTEEKLRKTIQIFIVLFLCSAVPNLVFFPESFNVHAVIYKNLLFSFGVIIAAASIDNKDNRWDIPVLCIVCSIADPLFALNFLPVIAILLFYRLDSKKFTRDYRWLCLVSLVAAALGFLLFFKGRLNLLNNLSVSFFVKHYWKTILISMGRVLPLIIIFTAVWINAFIKSRDKWFRITAALILLESVFPLTALLFKGNYTDVVMAALFAQFCFLGIFLYSKDKEFAGPFHKFVEFLEANQFLVLLIIVYLAAFSIFRFNSVVQTWFWY